MSFSRYPEYKDSGVVWLGEVPVHWSVAPFKRMIDIQNGADHKAIEQDDGYPVIGSGGPFAYASEYMFDGESVLLGRKGTIDKPLYVTGPFWTVDTMYWTRIAEDAYGKFCYYAALTIPFDYYSTNTALPSMTKGALSAHLVAMPSLPEQREIAQFLDAEVAKINDLVSEQEKLIALLKEKRQAVISHAVTKGLDPNVPMKDSGIEWLGEVPAHWRITPIKHLVRLRSGGTPSKENLDYWGGDIPWASAKDLKVDKLADTIDHITEMAVSSGAATLVPPGSILIVVRGMILARIFPVSEACIPMAINQDLKAILPAEGVEASFLAWLLRGSAQESLNRLDEAGHGTKALRMDAWTSMQLPVPPVLEQEVISSYLWIETSKIDLLIVEAEQGIVLLNERRSALISAAVTGKIDVRKMATSEAA